MEKLVRVIKLRPGEAVLIVMEDRKTSVHNSLESTKHPP